MFLSQRLPLHIALNRGAPVDVIRALMDADEGGKSIRAETHDGMRPIHAALGSKPSTDIIELLANADSKVSEYEQDGTADIFSQYKGLLPIHMACLNSSSKSIVSILLDKDVDGNTLLEKASDRRSKSYNETLIGAMKSNSFSAMAFTRQKPTLHYAILHSPDEVIRLFLNRLELEGEASQSILDVNSEGRCALHLACMQNSSPYIIKMLLKIDTGKESVAAVDNEGLRPIHYACNHKDAQRKTVELLLEAEQTFRKMNNHIPLSEKSAFWFACKAQAPSDVLELLVSQPGFGLRDFDRVSMRHDLADNIKINPILQRQINRKMARRFNFFKYVNDLVVMHLILICHDLFFLTLCLQVKRSDNFKFCCSLYFLLGNRRLFTRMHEAIPFTNSVVLCGDFCAE
jgi:ankyrin repeat protein